MQDQGLEVRNYHHGNLREALMLAAIKVIEEDGLEHFSLRTVAKRVGVSAGAPFRHFASKTALLTTLAEEAMLLLRSHVEQAIGELEDDDPLMIFEAIGRGYLRWAIGYPTHFRIISSRSLIDFYGSALLVDTNEEIRQLMINLLNDAKMRGILREDLDFDHLLLGARALVYGLARMANDGHLPEWHPDHPIEPSLQLAMSIYVSQIRKPLT